MTARSADSEFKSLLYGLAFLHAVLLGRRAYGPLGWTVPYAFNDSDMRISMRQLRAFVHAAPRGEPPIALLRYTAGECNYGALLQ